MIFTASLVASFGAYYLRGYARRNAMGWLLLIGFIVEGVTWITSVWGWYK